MDDVARVSGLSRSTVDRVLNGRAGVRPETVEKVETALRALGYAPSALSARKPAQVAQVQLMIMSGSNPFFSVMRDAAEHVMQLPLFAGIRVSVAFHDPYAPQTLLAAIEACDPEMTHLVTPGIDRPDIALALNRLVDRGCRVVTMVSDVPNSRRYAYAGQDNFAAGRTAGRLMAGFLPDGGGKVAVLVGHLEFRHLLDRMAGFRQLMGLERPDLELVQPQSYGASGAEVAETLRELKVHRDTLRGIYLAGGGQPGLLDAMAEFAPDKVCVIGHELHRQSRAALTAGHFRALLAHDTVQVVQRAVEIVLGLVPPDRGQCPIHVYVPDNLPDPRL